MVVDETIVHTTNLEEHLGLTSDPEVHFHPTVCQIGGNSHILGGQATNIVTTHYGYDEINLNCECPSNRVSERREFGAALMKKEDTAANMVRAMIQNAGGVKVSVKTRIGVDDLDDMDYLVGFITKLVDAGCRRFIIHARKVLLNGLSPAKNRVVPPLNYPRVYELCKHFPECEFILNGGIPGLKAAKSILYGRDSIIESVISDHNISVEEKPLEDHCVPCMICQASNGSCTAPPENPPPNLVGCMLGRAAMDNPSMFWDVDRYFYGEKSNPCKNRREVLIKYCEYLERRFPRRCCDDDERITSWNNPAPKVKRVQDYCDICREVYRNNDKRNSIQCRSEFLDKESNDDTCCNKGEILKVHVNRDNVQKLSKFQTKYPGIKITSHVIGHSFKPIQGICFGLKNSKAFKKVFLKLSVDISLRNCGPGFLIRKTMESMPGKVLDRNFIRTEDLSNNDVISHAGPILQNSSD